MAVFCSHVARSADNLKFAGRLGAIGPSNILREPGYYVWGGSAIRAQNGRYYLFYSRWKTGIAGRTADDRQLFKGMRGWLKYSEIAVAVSPSPTGPFKPVTTVLRGSGNVHRWDCYDAHNPEIHRFGGKVYLYYIADNPGAGAKHWRQYVNSQRIGVVVAGSVADLLAGHYQRCARPIMAPDGTNTFGCAVNPSVTKGRDGHYLMMFKAHSAARDEHMVFWVARADQPDGPFKLVGPALTRAAYSAEDPCFWYDRQRDRYYAIVKDFSKEERGLSPQFGALALITSVRGWGDWRPAKHPLVSLRQYTDRHGRLHNLNRLERPKLLCGKAGQPVALYCAAAGPGFGHGAPTFNLQFSIKPQI